jgi:hypothetical protein
MPKTREENLNNKVDEDFKLRSNSFIEELKPLLDKYQVALSGELVHTPQAITCKPVVVNAKVND